MESNVEPGRVIMISAEDHELLLDRVRLSTEAVRNLKAELETERKWREDLQAFTIDQAVEIGKLRAVLRKIEQATTEALARKVP